MSTDDSNRDGESSRLDRAAERTRETLEKAKDGMAAGASGLARATRKAASETADKAGRAVAFVRESEADTALQAKVSDTTENALHQAADKVGQSAPTIGRGVEGAARVAGAALHKAAHPVGVVLGAIAGTVGGWWNKAAGDKDWGLPDSEDQACRAHFATVTVLPAGMTYDRARTGYALGYLAARNPDYQGRSFEDVEADLRQGFAREPMGEYDDLREFTRYGYRRGAGGPI